MPIPPRMTVEGVPRLPGRPGAQANANLGAASCQSLILVWASQRNPKLNVSPCATRQSSPTKAPTSNMVELTNGWPWLMVNCVGPTPLGSAGQPLLQVPAAITMAWYPANDAKVNVPLKSVGVL